MNTDNNRYSDDQPGSDPTHDKLGIAAFSKRLAKIILELDAPNGYVIGLSGGWGSGKTTAINYMRYFIAQSDPNPSSGEGSLIDFEFRPWLASGHEDLISAFFKVLEELLELKRPIWKDAAAATASLGSSIANAASKLSWLTMLADPGTLGVSTEFAKVGLRKLANDWAAVPSLQKSYDTLHGVLKNGDTKILAIIDDVDRLQPEEIRAMMMMVKTVGQLPNIIYLLSYDRNVVWPALQASGASEYSRTNFAEKIVQQEIALPSPGSERLVALFYDQVAFLRIDASKGSRWETLEAHGPNRWLRTPRDVLRLANNLRFGWHVISDYLDPTDYVVIEGLRTFDIKVFDWVRDSRAFFFFSRTRPWTDRERYAHVLLLKNQLAASEVEPAKNLLSLLFPLHRKYFEFDSEEAARKSASAGLIAETYHDINARYGLAYLPSYDTYFRLYAPQNVPGREEVDNFFRHQEDEEWIYDQLSSPELVESNSQYQSTTPLFSAIIARLKSRGRPAPTGALLNASLRVFDDSYSDDTPATLSMSESAFRLIDAVLGQCETGLVIAKLTDPSERPISLFASAHIAEQISEGNLSEFFMDKGSKDILFKRLGREIQDAAGNCSRLLAGLLRVGADGMVDGGLAA